MGNNHFSEQFFETGIAKKLGRIFSAGIKFQYHQWLLNEQRYENSSVIIPEIDLYAEPLKDFSFGVIIRNPVRVRMSTIEKKKLPAMIDPGISYKVSDKLILAISTIQLSDRPISCQAGVEYKFHPRLSLRFGWHTDPVCESYGFELMLSKLKLDLSLQTHPFLGNSTSLALTFPL